MFMRSTVLRHSGVFVCLQARAESVLRWSGVRYSATAEVLSALTSVYGAGPIWTEAELQELISRQSGPGSGGRHQAHKARRRGPMNI